MPNKCTMCGKIHPDDAKYLLEGCNECGNKFFFYVREERIKQMEQDTKDLTRTEIKEIEEDIRDIIPKEAKKDETVILDLEAIRIVKPGKYMIDVTTLFNQRPIVIRVGMGRYEIDLSTIKKKWRGKMLIVKERSKPDNKKASKTQKNKK